MAKIVTRRLARSWSDAAKGSDAYLIFSPYVTSKTADRIAESAGAACELHTDFTPLSFVTGASSIGALRRVRRAGGALFHVVGLHAKVVLADDVYATVGSQNLTRGGERRKEVTVVFRDDQAVSAVKDAVRPWIQGRTPITEQDLDAMEKLVAPFRRAHLALLKDLDAQFFELTAHRATREARARRIQALRTSLRGPRFRASSPKYARVEWIAHNSWFSDGNSSLRALSGTDLTRWMVGGQLVQLARLSRYACIDEESGRLGWGRIGQTRITKFGTGVTKAATIHFGGHRYRVDIAAVSEIEKDDPSNVAVTLIPLSGGGSVRVDGWFGVDSFEVVRTSPGVAPEDDGAAATTLVRRALEGDSRVLIERIRSCILQSFRYQHNLHGQEASSFLGPSGTRRRLRLLTDGSIRFIVMDRGRR